MSDQILPYLQAIDSTIRALTNDFGYYSEKSGKTLNMPQNNWIYAQYSPEKEARRIAKYLEVDENFEFSFSIPVEELVPMLAAKNPPLQEIADCFVKALIENPDPRIQGCL